MSTDTGNAVRAQGPLEDLEHWEEFLQQRYPENEANIPTSKAKTEFIVKAS